jgi:Domain of unknown function (DUF1906)
MRHRKRAFGFAVLATALTLATGSMGTANATSPPDTEVSYRGHHFTVPDTWKVIDLAKAPRTCVRFDRHAVYLGTPSTEQSCPARTLGRTEALLVEPDGATGHAAQVTENPTARTYAASADGITVTATYGADRAAIEKVLRSDALPVGGASAQRRQPAAAAVPADATSFQGKGFDACATPSTALMNAWKGSSPYGAVGMYIGGVNRSCSQPNLDAGWVSAQYGNGWRFFPLYVGLQVQRTESCNGCEVITDPAPQGAEAARDAVNQATALGFAQGSVLYFDMESYDRGGANTTKSLTFLDAWSDTLHQLGYRSGVYGQVSGVILDLVDAADGDQYTVPDVIDFARWDEDPGTDDPQIPGDLWPTHQRIKQYQGGHNETHGGMSLNIDSDTLDVGQGGTTPPTKKDTKVAYAGPASVANGAPAKMSAKLTEADGKPVGDRPVSLTLGSGASAQTCKGTTDAQGQASCTIDPVKQPLTADATVPVTVEFAGDAGYNASKATATVKLRYVTGRAYGLSATAPLVSVKPTPDTGDVRTADTTTVAPPCTQTISTLLLSASALCAKVAAGPGTVTSTANLQQASIGVLGLPAIGLSGVTASSTSTCTAQSGSVKLTLTVAGVPVDIGDAPNVNVDLGVLGTKLVVNEQAKTADGGLTVNAAHLTAPGVNVVVASTTSAAHNCA